MKSLPVVLAVLALVGCGGPMEADQLDTSTQATHSWGGYHWGRTSNPFTIKLGDNVSSAWDSYLATASSDWTSSTVLNTTIVTGGTAPKTCKPTLGRVEVCNERYGNNGWLGIAQIWLSGGHIAQGVVKLNDTYYNTATYNTPAWRLMVMCQEIGHTFGLDHQDENFNNANLGTCMDYTNNPSTNQHPNSHDYSMLSSIYQHTDSSTTVGANLPDSSMLENPAGWGNRVSAQGNIETYIREFGEGRAVLTKVTWTLPQ